MPETKKESANLPEPIELKVENNKKDKPKKPKSKKDKPALRRGSGQDKKKELYELTGSEDLKTLVKRSVEWSQVIYKQNKKIKHRLTLMTIGSYLKLIIIVAPIILAIIYLPALLDQVMGQYGGLLEGLGEASGMGQMMENMPFNIGDILSNMSPEEMQKLQEATGAMPK